MSISVYVDESNISTIRCICSSNQSPFDYLAKPFGIALIAHFVSLSLCVSLSLLHSAPLHKAYKVAYLQGIRRAKLKTRSASKGSIKETIPIPNSNW